MSKMSCLKKENLYCEEFLQPEYVFEEASPEEIKFLKPLTILNSTEIRNGFNFISSKLFVVAGGYAAYAAGHTTTYSDIDIWTNRKRVKRTLFYEDDEYEGLGIQQIRNEYSYQFITTTYSSNNLQNYMQMILSKFDLEDCCFAFAKLEGKYYKLRRFIKYSINDIYHMKGKRMKLYNDRIKTVKSLKWLALTSLKSHYENDDIYNFIKNYNILF